MRIGFIGAGRVGYTLSKYLNDKYHNVVGIYSKDINDAIDCARFSISEYYKNLMLLVNDCDTLFLTVNDDAIEGVVDNLISLNVCDKTLIHTSGSITSDIFKKLKYQNRCVSLHPIYAFNDKYSAYKSFDSAYLTLEGDKLAYPSIKALFNDRVVEIDKDSKVKYHAGCVMVSNLMCALMKSAEDLFKSIGIDDIEIFKPLILNNINNILENGADKALTGPVKRNDYGTVKKHLESLSDDEKKIYIPLSLKLIEMCNEDNDYSNMKKLLEGDIKND
ncbi:MAG: DUF2520 domain-containing protein [Acholeplasmatales bacterium]|nr:DUF2520 domain-containing protein [Acholeplasmatales bacterium]